MDNKAPKQVSAWIRQIELLCGFEPTELKGLNDALLYDPATGALTHRRTLGRAKAGVSALYWNPQKHYYTVSFKGKRYPATRLIPALVTDSEYLWPFPIVCVDGNKRNLEFDNLDSEHFSEGFGFSLHAEWIRKEPILTSVPLPNWKRLKAMRAQGPLTKQVQTGWQWAALGLNPEGQTVTLSRHETREQALCASLRNRLAVISWTFSSAYRVFKYPHWIDRDMLKNTPELPKNYTTVHRATDRGPIKVRRDHKGRFKSTRDDEWYAANYGTTTKEQDDYHPRTFDPTWDGQP